MAAGPSGRDHISVNSSRVDISPDRLDADLPPKIPRLPFGKIKPASTAFADLPLPPGPATMTLAGQFLRQI